MGEASAGRKHGAMTGVTRGCDGCLNDSPGLPRRRKADVPNITARFVRKRTFQGPLFSPAPSSGRKFISEQLFRNGLIFERSTQTMKQTLVRSILVAVALVSSSAAAAPPVRIGAVVANAGPAALLGNSFIKAIQLAKEDTHDTRRQYQLVIEEISGPDQAEAAIKKLIDVEKVDALIVGFSISGNIVKPYAETARIPMFCICSVAAVGDDVYTFTTMPVAEDEAAKWVAEAQREGCQTHRSNHAGLSKHQQSRSRGERAGEARGNRVRLR
jgi:substrate-binding family protein